MIGPDQMAMLQALMGGVAQPGVMGSGQNPTTQYGQQAITGMPTVPGGMLGTSFNQAVNPNLPNQPMPGGSMGPTGQMPSNQMMQQPYQSFATAGDHGGGNAGI